MTSGVKLYPVLEESAPEGEQFRLAHIRDIQRQLETELEKYARVRRKYASIYSGLSNVNTGATTGAVVAGSVGAGLLGTGLGIPASLILSIVAVGFGGASVVTSVVMKKIVKKLEKHEAISTLASSKLSSLKLTISKALEDLKISGEEFKRVQIDFDDYKTKKSSIQTKSRAEYSKPIDIDDLKKEFLEKGIQIGKEEKQKIESLVNK